MAELRGVKFAVGALHVLAAVFSIVVFALAADTLAQHAKAQAEQQRQLDALKGSMRGAWGLPMGNGMRKMLQMPDLSAFNKQLETQMKAAMDQMGAAAAAVPAPNQWGLADTLIGFAMYTSLTGAMWNIILALNNLMPKINACCLKRLSARWPAWARTHFVELVVCGVWWVFWMATAGCFSNTPLAKNISNCYGNQACDRFNAFLALSWLTWLIWMTVLGMTAVQYVLYMRNLHNFQGAEPAVKYSAGTRPMGAEAAAVSKAPVVQMVGQQGGPTSTTVTVSAPAAVLAGPAAEPAAGGVQQAAAADSVVPVSTLPVAQPTATVYAK